MLRWKVRYSSRKPGWFYADTVAFVSAVDSSSANQIVESAAEPGEVREAWETMRATPEMEARHERMKADKAAWLENIYAGQSKQNRPDGGRAPF